MTVVILGAGVGGKLAAQGIANKYPDAEVYLVGPQVKAPSGLFYFNEKVPGIAEKPVKVTYSLLGEMSESAFEAYQIKSRGSYDPSIKISSFDKVGKEETGYLLNPNFKLNNVTGVLCSCALVDYTNKRIILDRQWLNLPYIEYDLLISTVPLNIFVGLLGGSSDNIVSMMNYQPVYVKEMKMMSPDSIEEIVVHYDLTDSPYYRHSSYYTADKKCVVEMRAETIKKIVDFTQVLRPGKIVPGPNKNDNEILKNLPANIEREHPDMKILGRYARWDYHYLVTDTYNDALKFVENNLKLSD